MRMRSISVSLILLVMLGLQARLTQGNSHPLSPTSFDDGLTADLVVGVPWEDVSVAPDNFQNAGALHVLFGSSPGGLSGTGDLYWDQSTDGIGDVPDPQDNFGMALAIGDFNCDGHDDLAVGVPGQAVFYSAADRDRAGIVQVFYGYSSGLAAAGHQTWSQGVGNIGSNPEDGDQFGSTLAAADFDGDGCDDLAVGSPTEDVNLNNAGMVQIIYGSASGLTDAGNTTFYQGYNGLLESEGGDDRFGSALAAGDFNGDGYADLAIGVPGEDLAEYTDWDAGVVHIVYGSQAGLTTADNFLFHQDLAFMEDETENSDEFGAALVSGNFNGDAFDDLAIGVPGEGDGWMDLYGAVQVVFGWPFGISPLGSILIDKAALGLINTVGSEFGNALASSDINRDGYSDLAIGAPRDQYGTYDPVESGIVYVLYGERFFSDPYDYESVIQGVNDLLDSPEEDDYFGAALAMGDFNGDLCADLAIGVPDEDIGSPNVVNAGAVQVIFGSTSGLDRDGNQLWYQGFNGLGGARETSDLFGVRLAARPLSITQTYLPLVMR